MLSLELSFPHLRKGGMEGRRGEQTNFKSCFFVHQGLRKAESKAVAGSAAALLSLLGEFSTHVVPAVSLCS